MTLPQLIAYGDFLYRRVVFAIYYIASFLPTVTATTIGHIAILPHANLFTLPCSLLPHCATLGVGVCAANAIATTSALAR